MIEKDGAKGSWHASVREIPDFPQPGVLFRDLLPVMADARAWRMLLDDLTEAARAFRPDLIAAPEARGFLLAAPVADRLQAGVLAVRKAGKLPRPVVGQDYALEYGTARLEVEQRALQPGARVLVVDDVLATGGTVAAAARLVERIGGSVAGHLFAMEIQALGGRRQLTGQVVALWAV